MKRKAGLFNPLIITLMICLLPASGICDMQSLDDAEMHDIYAEGFSEFTLNRVGADATMELWLNINTSQYTEIDTLRLGYYDYYEYKKAEPQFGWDHEWDNVKIGNFYFNTVTNEYVYVEPFETEGFFIKAEFEDFDLDSRKLKSLTYGMDNVKGDISADFVSFTGKIDDGIGGPIEGHRMNLGPDATIHSRGEGTRADPDFQLTLSFDGDYVGYWMTFNNAELHK